MYNLAQALASQGRLTEAADLHNSLGGLYLEGGQLPEAIACFQRALRLQPRHAMAHSNLGQALRRQGDLATAQAHQQIAVQLRPDLAAAHLNLGGVLQARGKLAEARVAYQTAIRLAPESVTAHVHLGKVLQRQGDVEAAGLAYQTALRLQADCVEAHRRLGIIRQAQGRYEEAKAALHTAVRLCPEDAEAHYYLGMVAQQQDDLAGAVAAYQAALHYQPAHALAHYNLGVAYQQLHQLDAASWHYREALRWRADLLDASCNLAAVLHEQGHLEEALASCQTALQHQPDYPLAHWNRAIIWLSQGRLRQGWAAYAWRWVALNRPPRPLPYPRWGGEPLQHRTILVWPEQGVGDELLFASCLPNLLSRADHVILECDPRLAPLFSRSFPTVTVCGRPRQARAQAADGPRRAIDVHCPAGDLPGHWRPHLGHFPRRQGYLQVAPERQAQWRIRLAALGPGLKIGLAWRSRQGRRQAAQAYAALAAWEPVLRVAGVHWVNLQYDGAAAELAWVEAQWGVKVWQWEALDVEQDLDGVAALMTVLDIVIAPDTAVAQLGGAVGAPVWRLTMFGEDEMGLGTGVSPWWPTLRVYRQARPGEWGQVMARLATDIRQLRRKAAGRRPRATGNRKISMLPTSPLVAADASPGTVV